MRIVQKSPLLSTSFVFEAENLICIRKDWHGVQRLEVPYGSIRMEPGSGLEQNAALFTCAVALFFWGLVQAAHALLHANPYGLLFLLTALRKKFRTDRNRELQLQELLQQNLKFY